MKERADMLLSGGNVLLPGGDIEPIDVRIRGGYIVGLGPGAALAQMDLGGRLLLPGIVDIHGDAFESVVQPRPETMIDLTLALEETDRQLVANGVTTAFYGLSWSWESNRGLRSGSEPARFLDQFEELRPNLRCDSQLHLRYEIHHLDALETVLQWVHEARIDLLAFNDHLNYIEEKIEDSDRIGILAARNGQTPEEYLAAHRAMRERYPHSLAGVERLAEAGRLAAIPMASHDEESPDVRRWYHELGCRICEFPVNEATACHALELGDDVVLGAPNALRGSSLYKRLSARRCAVEGLCTVLASDYYYPSLLAAAWDIHSRRGLELGRAWDLVSANPARALGLTDRGRIEPGLRADLIAAEVGPNGLLQAACTWTSGTMAYMGGTLAAQAFSGQGNVGGRVAA
ncbi:alpha-D-ribose 1-methylphosphonate 5-triphosphate diphosphatase [Oceanidesulfovibrio marinus]|uniref:Alpha-D-ribose 1-methylphosphonate 5-triphosphate diphosphatase n=1 Tax=Oceanidesulfovibrio marinus TaxID=370038 RepID=A0ABX6NDV3_9BACT|nr:alpha-D-ribose 1-methylphosphonate 5-triphosphate diphosphatase [Oceanidesulfovibrio marinus]QJT07940.1 alpha-D-ribose 1-methylphosphonate 5-triphosphate diphosphatase [Oceanidesulfovibrio marinus]